MLGPVARLTSGRLLARNVAINLVGWVAPAAAALVAIPLLLRGLGADRFGVLTLAWALVGYFSLFDLGIGRALTQVLADRTQRGDQSASPAVAWAGLWLLLPVGAVGAVALWLAAPRLATEWLHVPAAVQPETRAALRLLAVAVLPMVLTSAMRAVLEAAQAFRLINAMRVPLGVLSFLAPALLLPFGAGLRAAVGILVALRIALFVAHVVAVSAYFPAMRRPRLPTGESAAELWHVAGWMTVSSVVSPVLVSVDRLVAGAALPVAALAHYATASEVATKMWLFTAALQPVLFPAIAATFRVAPARTALLFDRGARVTLATLFVPALALAVFAREGLTLWVGAPFAREAAPVLQVLAIAVLVNAVGQMAYAVVQGAARADLAAKLHLLELPAYLATLWWLMTGYGTVGVALAWAARMIVDTALLLLALGRVLPEARTASRRALLAVLASAAVIAGLTRIASLGGRLGASALVVVVGAALAWRLALDDTERRLARELWARRPRVWWRRSAEWEGPAAS